MSNNINGGGRSRNVMSSVDFYRRVPKDLTEVSTMACVSHWICLVVRMRPCGVVLVKILLASYVMSSFDNPKQSSKDMNNDTFSNIFLFLSSTLGHDFGCCHVAVCYWDHGDFVSE
jgi:hypothetical protein